MSFLALIGSQRLSFGQSSNLPMGQGSSGPIRRSSAIPFDSIPNQFRDRIVRILQRPTISARAEPEEFTEGIYDWLIEHPDRTSLAWRRLGYPCAAIAARAPDGFGWTDGQGTEIAWRTAFKNKAMHIWLAEGQAKLGPMMLPIQVRAVAVLHHSHSATNDGRKVVIQNVEVYLQTDSKAAAMVARIIGPAAPRLADSGASQLLLFFSGLTRYFNDHPEDIQTLLAPAR